MCDVELQDCLKKRYGALPTRMERLSGGKNSGVFRCEMPDGLTLALKNYHRDSRDTRDRLGVEFGALTFLWRQGVRQVPEPLWMDRSVGCAAYGMIHGHRIDGIDIGSHEILTCVQFLHQLNRLRVLEESRQLPLASEACFSFEAVLVNIEHRLQRLEAVGENSLLASKLHGFLDHEFKPLLASARTFRGQNPGESWWDIELPWSERCLSPSDFGFHNALQRPNGDFVFLDFEYFGWDDPAKLIVDFLHHPAMQLSHDSRQVFIDQTLELFDDSGRLRQRLPAAYILFGLKWCMILLNEFVPEDFARRVFSNAVNQERESVQTRQLACAQKLLSHLQEAIERFPYDL